MSPFIRFIHIFILCLLFPAALFAAEIDSYISRQTASPQTNTLSRQTTLIVGTPVSGTIGSGATTSEGWLDSTNFTAGQHYLLLAWSKLNTSSTSKMHLMQIKHATTIFGSASDIKETENTSTSFMTPYFWFNVWTAVTGEDIDLYFGGWNAGNDNRVSNATLVALDLSDLSFDGTCDSNGAAGQNFYCTGNIDASLVGDGSLTTTPTTKVSLNFTPANDGDAWWIVGFVNGDVATITTSAISGQLTVDGTVRNSFSVEGENVIEGPLYTMGYVTTFNADSTTISIEISETAADQAWRYASIFALRLNAFSQFLFDTTSGSGGNIPAFPTLSTMESTSGSSVKARKWIQAAGSVIDDNGALVTCSLTAENDVDLVALAGGGTHNATDLWPHVLFNASSLTNGEAAGGKYKCTEQTDTANNLNDSWLVNFSLDKAVTTISGTGDIGAGQSISMAINGILLSKTILPTISGGVWTDTIGALSKDDQITVWNDGQANSSTGIGLTVFSSGTAVSGVELNSGKLTLGSNQDSTIDYDDLDNYSDAHDANIFYSASPKGAKVFNLDPSGLMLNDELVILSGDTWSINAADETISADTIINYGTVSIAGAAGKTTFSTTSITNQNFSTIKYTGDSNGGADGSIDMKFHDSSDPFVVYNLTLVDSAGSADTFNMEQSYDIGGTLTITSGVLSQSVGTISLAGNLTNTAGDFQYAGELTLDGAIAQSITMGTHNAGLQLLISNSSSITFLDSFSIAAFTDLIPGSTLIFSPVVTGTISGTLNLRGSPSSKITLRSLIPSAQWDFNVTGSDQRVFFVDVTDATAITNDIHAYSSTNGGNNDSTAASPHWEFHPLVGSVMNIQ